MQYTKGREELKKKEGRKEKGEERKEKGKEKKTPPTFAYLD